MADDRKSKGAACPLLKGEMPFTSEESFLFDAIKSLDKIQTFDRARLNRELKALFANKISSVPNPLGVDAFSPGGQLLKM